MSYHRTFWKQVAALVREEFAPQLPFIEASLVPRKLWDDKSHVARQRLSEICQDSSVARHSLPLQQLACDGISMK